jgi:magnesium transporter
MQPNKILTHSVNPLYYVTFTTATLCASFILFSGFNTTDTVNTLSLLSGFLVTFMGVYLLNLSRSDPNGAKLIGDRGQLDATGTDMVSSIQTRLSMQSRRSNDPHRRLSVSSQHGDREGLIRAYDEEEMAGFGLTDLAEESDDGGSGGRLTPNRVRMNGDAHGGKYQGDAIELQERKKKDDR